MITITIGGNDLMNTLYKFVVDKYNADPDNGGKTLTVEELKAALTGELDIMLLLSMDDRDWAIFCYGENSEYTFSESGRKVLKEVFLDNFKDNDWAGGFEDYIRECARFLESAAEGKPVKQSPVTLILIFCGVALLIALVATLTIWERMNSVAMETTAHAYISGNLELTEKTDRFTHSTETSRKIERSSSSSESSSESGGGGSGSSGKF